MAKFITLTSNVVSKEKLFKRREQYCYVDRIKMDVTCPLCGDCAENTKDVIHYRLNIDGEYYYIPSFAAVKYDKVWFEEEKDIRKQIRRENMQPSDLSAMYKEVTGNDLDNTYKADRNRTKEIYNINFDNYGVSDPKLAKSTSNYYDILYNRRRQCLVQESTEPDTLHQGLNVYFPEQEIIYCGETTTITLTPTITGIKDRYTYLWSTGETTETIEVTINPGEEKMFSIQVTDDIGCSRVASVIVKVELYGSFDESFDCSFDIGCLTC
jgi:hypothetical protein